MTEDNGDLISVTEEAAEKAMELIEERDLHGMGIRVSVDYNGSQPSYVLEFSDNPEETDLVVETNGLEIYIEEESKAAIENGTIDFVDDGVRQGFTVHEPHQTGEMEFDDSLEGKIREFLAMNFPQIQGHGGKAVIDDLDQDKGYLKLSLEGSCSGCGISDATANAIKKQMPVSVTEINKVEISAGDDDGMQIDPPV